MHQRRRKQQIKSSDDEQFLDQRKEKNKDRYMGSGRENLETNEILKKLVKKVEELEKAVTFSNNLVEEMKHSFEEIKRENKQLRKEHDKIKVEVELLHKEVTEMKDKMAINALAKETQERKKNIIVSGLNKKEDVVKVMKKLDVPIDEEELKFKQVLINKERKAFIVTFKEEVQRNLVLMNRRTRGAIDTESMEIGGPKRKIFINEDLPKLIQDLLKKGRELKSTGFKLVWAKDGNDFCRKSEYSKIILLINHEQIDELKRQ